MPRLSYLASPYSSTDIRVVEERFLQACRAATWLIERGYVVFSPIAHSHQISAHAGISTAWEVWQPQCVGILDRADELIVLELDGWGKSIGVKAEIELAIKRDIPVLRLIPQGADYELTGGRIR